MTVSYRNDRCLSLESGEPVCSAEYNSVYIFFGILLTSAVLSFVYFLQQFQFTKSYSYIIGLTWVIFMYVVLLYQSLPLFGIFF